MFTRVKGTQDILDMSLFNFFISTAKKHMEIYNFTEISTPIIEYTDLFKRTLGNETDVVTKEMYTLNTHDESICLRPEATASCVRAFVNGGIQAVPWKVFTWGSMFRHERPQKGRYREFHQFDMEIIGANSIAHDVQFIKMLDRYFSETLKIQNYALIINFLGDETDRARYKEVLKNYLDNLSDLCSTCTDRKDKNIMRVFDCKNPACQSMYAQAPCITDYLSEASQAEFTQLKELLENLSVSFTHVPTLVRGLDYYDKTAFEFVSTDLGAQNAFCGGGRYNKLVKQIGAKSDYPSIGAAIGIERLLLILETIKDTLPYNIQLPLHVVIPLTPEQKPLALLIADELQAHNLSTEILLDDDSVKSMMRQANRLGAKFALLIGPDEQQAKTIVLKNMINATEETVHQKDLLAKLR